MSPDLMPMITQFGMAGLIAWMWLTERRAAAAREIQLTESHDRIKEQRLQLEALMQVVSEQTRAVTALESGQRAIHALLERLAGHPPVHAPARSPTAAGPAESAA